MKIDEASFRDPDGFVYTNGHDLLRQVNNNYKDDYIYLVNSGLYKKLTSESYLITHEEVNAHAAKPEIAYKIIKPQFVPFISYPYEWCFEQMKDAALLTLKIQSIALSYGMTLKDASAYNIQFFEGKPILIDSLSFTQYRKNQPWIAYRQFCQHFLAPLALMSKIDIRLQKLLMVYLDGIPLNLASNLLPKNTWFSYSLLSHIHLHALSQSIYSKKIDKKNNYHLSMNAFFGLIDSLEVGIKKLKWIPGETEWSNYYDNTNYNPRAFSDKEKFVEEFVKIVKPKHVWDLGANTAKFSRIASENGIKTIAFDIDPSAVQKAYLISKQENINNLLPLLLDITNPSPAVGWQNKERESLINRGPADMVMALALVHHLAIAHNIPLSKLAQFFRNISKWLVIEFIPKSDSNSQRLLSRRDDIFSEYTKENFVMEFSKYFVIKRCERIKNSSRILYLMQNREI